MQYRQKLSLFYLPYLFEYWTNILQGKLPVVKLWMKNGSVQNEASEFF